MFDSIDQRGFGAESFLESQAVDLASFGPQEGHALAVVARLKGVTVGAEEQGFAHDADGVAIGVFVNVGGLEDHNTLSCGSFAIGLRLTGQNGAGDVVGTPAAAKGGDGHLS